MWAAVIIPLPSAMEVREDDLRRWPQITYTSIFSYFTDSVATDCEACGWLITDSLVVMSVLFKAEWIALCHEYWYLKLSTISAVWLMMRMACWGGGGYYCFVQPYCDYPEQSGHLWVGSKWLCHLNIWAKLWWVTDLQLLVQCVQVRAQHTPLRHSGVSGEWGASSSLKCWLLYLRLTKSNSPSDGM